MHNLGEIFGQLYIYFGSLRYRFWSLSSMLPHESGPTLQAQGSTPVCQLPYSDKIMHLLIMPGDKFWNTSAGWLFFVGDSPALSMNYSAIFKIKKNQKAGNLSS